MYQRRKQPPKRAPVGEVVTYAPYQPGINKYLGVVQGLVLAWAISWLVVFLILTFSNNRSFMNNWAGLLSFALGSALIVVAAQLLLYMFYVSANNFAMGGEIGINNIHYRTFMSQAHTKEIVLALFFSIIIVFASGGLWYDWLCRYKDSCSFDSNKAATSVTTILITPAQMVEYRQYLVMNFYLAVLHLFLIWILIKVMWVHVRPLRAVTHLISATTTMKQDLLVGKHSLTKTDIF